MNAFVSRISLLFVLLPILSWAHEEPAEEPAEPPGPWSGEVALGYLSSSGNTDTSSGTGRVKVGYTKGKWEHVVEAKGLGSSDDDGTTAEAYEAMGKSLRNLNENNYVFGKLEWKKNRFSAFKTQTFETVGYGRRILNDDTYKLNFEVGAGYSQQKKFVDEDTGETDNENNGTFTLGGDFNWNISETATFEQILSSMTTSDNTSWESITRLKVNVVNSVALAVGYTIQGNTDVDAGRDRTDRYTSITLDYSW